jgi:hypothetical protein
MAAIQPSYSRTAGGEMTDLETYLNAATRGLWGKKKLEVREELEAHVLEQTRKLELQGFEKNAAIAQVLEQVGPPAIVAYGMIGVHTMPRIVQTTSLIALFLVGTIASLPTSIAQVTTLSNVMTERQFADYIWLNLASLNATLKQAGVNIGMEKQGYRLTFPEGGKAFVQSTLTRNGQGYISAMEFIHALENTNLNINISGYRNPKISIGETTITLGTTASPVEGNLFYAKPLLEIAEMHIQNFGLLEFSFPTIVCCNESKTIIMTLPTTKQHLVKADVSTGQVYGLLTAIHPENPMQKGVRFGIAQAKKTGELEITTSETRLEFVKNIDSIYDKPTSTSSHIKAVLIELSRPYKRFGGLNSTKLRVLLPEAPRSEAIR